LAPNNGKVSVSSLRTWLVIAGLIVAGGAAWGTLKTNVGQLENNYYELKTQVAPIPSIRVKVETLEHLVPEIQKTLVNIDKSQAAQAAEIEYIGETIRAINQEVSGLRKEVHNIGDRSR